MTFWQHEGHAADSAKTVAATLIANEIAGVVRSFLWGPAAIKWAVNLF